MKEKYPGWICRTCGNLYGNRKCGVSTWHEDVCGVCGEIRMCTEPRDFGYLKPEWRFHKWTKTMVDDFNQSDFNSKVGHLEYTEESNPGRVYLPTEEEMFDNIGIPRPDPMNGVLRKQWLSPIQVMNDELSINNNFSVDYISAFRLVPEVGELVDAVLKYEGIKKIKSTDSIEDLKEEIRDGIGDVLVLLAQVASHYKIDIQEAYIDTYMEVSKRSYH